jgi:hypothetical protein
VTSMMRADAKVTVPEAARRLGLPGGDVYRLLFRGELEGGPADDGAVYVAVASLEQYLAGQSPQDDESG